MLIYVIYEDGDLGNQGLMPIWGMFVKPCCQFAKQLWHGYEKWKVSPGLYGGSPTLGQEGYSLYVPFNFCISCGAKVEQISLSAGQEGYVKDGLVVPFRDALAGG